MKVDIYMNKAKQAVLVKSGDTLNLNKFRNFILDWNSIDLNILKLENVKLVEQSINNNGYYQFPNKVIMTERISKGTIKDLK